MSLKLDALDIRILDALQDDVTTPIAEIAERVASSKTVVWRRVQRLTERGAIRARVALLDHREVGLGIMVFASVKMGRHGVDVLPQFIDAVRACPQVIECHTLMGPVDFLLKILVADINEYENFVWQKLSRIDGVQEVHSSISMSQPVYTTRLAPRPTNSDDTPGGD
ncbi:Lrp/AsnC family transcriptional regulator [Solimonas terrae]|uniref:Lrp/AsnC family transcriptional regulator n=1 Tax=Solimonas terrae TaxID=1396819 RepID=A0A6M2BP46_9GAMM|nr:Lrp/AsnC family transcriptional regulator [Solimonas terrae]NGY04090.1 Lrp/AsnC family transcriptional regulator [Solimonas terrae]